MQITNTNNMIVHTVLGRVDALASGRGNSRAEADNARANDVTRDARPVEAYRLPAETLREAESKRQAYANLRSFHEGSSYRQQQAIAKYLDQSLYQDRSHLSDLLGVDVYV